MNIDCSETLTCHRGASADAGYEDALAPAPMEGGDAEELVCAPETGDCDHAGFNGCEIDLKSDSRHCGMCGRSCDGHCNLGKCTPLQVLASGQYNAPDSGGIAFGGTELYWVSSADPDAGAARYRVQRLSKVSGSLVTTLAENLSGADRIVFAGGKLFFGSAVADTIQSMGTDGSAPELFAERAPEFMYSAPNFCWFQYEFSIKCSDFVSPIRTVYSAAVEGFFDYDGNHVIWPENGALHTSSRGLLEIAKLSAPFGRLRRVGNQIFWSDAQGIWKMRDDGSSAAVQLVSGVKINDFVITADNDIYFAWQVLGTRAVGVSCLQSGVSNALELMPICGESLESDGSHLYFFDCTNARLVRLPLI